jgi:hypothetical protein
VQFITAINSNLTVFQSNIEPVLNVNNMLKALAIDVATGNWDDYAYNKNNYFLYKNPTTAQMEYIAYDTDNTFGVDWVNVDWATRSYLNWGKQTMPLSYKLLQIPAYFDAYRRYVNDSLTNDLLKPANIFPYIDQMRDFIRPAAYSDTYRTLDWNYGNTQFENGFSATVDAHTPYGIKPFLQKRYDRRMVDTENIPAANAQNVRCAPNPATAFCYIMAPENVLTPLFLYDIYGRMQRKIAAPNTAVFEIDLNGLAPGLYFIKNEKFANAAKIVVE